MPRRRFRITPWDCYVQVWLRNRTGLAPRRGGFARIDRHVCPPSRFLIFRTIGRLLEHLWNKLSVYGAIFSKFQAERQSNHQELWSGRWESKSSPLGFSRTYTAGVGLIWKDLVVSGTLTAASMSPCFPRMFLTTLRFASRSALGTACV
jgi:hypothetical protein